MTTSLLTLGHCCWGPKKAGMLSKTRKDRSTGCFTYFPGSVGPTGTREIQALLGALCEGGPSGASHFASFWNAVSEGTPGTWGSGWSCVVIQYSISSSVIIQSSISLLPSPESLSDFHAEKELGNIDLPWLRQIRAINTTLSRVWSEPLCQARHGAVLSIG